MRNINLYLFFAILFFACQNEPEDHSKIEVLFLGHDSEHHDSEAYLPLLAQPLAKKGINFTYTEDPEDLNKDNLRHYDALMLYANHDSITASQEKALLDFVEDGKGFLPIHSASYCFRNSPEFVSLVGGQFKSHGTGTFSAEIVNADHPVTRGLESFSVWDETYVHDKHNDDRTVLMERVEGGQREPYTWVRSYGDGRVFYTAFGHDERCWSNEGFQDLIERGIRWAVGEEKNAMLARLDLPELSYQPDPNIANYERRPEPLAYQLPLSTGDSKKLTQVPAGFRLELFAAEPDIINPIAMAWDERGRLWVIETVDYPNEVKEGDVGDDRIKICEDTNGDGKADKFTIFADGLNIPTSLVFARGGVIVAMAPHFLFLKDTDGDDKADVKETLITGWGKFDTHAGPSNLRYGFDNKIWGTVGYSGFEGKIAGQDFKFSQGFYRFAPDASDFEWMTNTSNNTWGLGFSETFDVFGSTANNAQSWYMAIPNRYLEKARGLPNIGGKKIAAYYLFHPITPNVRQVDVFGGFTAAAGHNLYTARAFPKKYWNRIALICEPTGHLLAQGVLEKEGAGFVTRDGWNMAASVDEWFSPVHAEVGPDGAVWVLDWYNFIIQHNPTPSPERGGYPAENGPGNAHVNPLRDREHGRIYRIVYKDAPEYDPIELSKSDAGGLIEGLKSENLFWRLTAQRLLVERGNNDVFPQLYALAGRTRTDEIGLNGPAIHALWTLHGLGAFAEMNEEAKEVLIKALNNPAAGVRKAALQVMPDDAWSREAMIEAEVLYDEDPHTQLVALLRMSDMPADDRVGAMLYQLSKVSDVVSDLWLSQAVQIAAAKHKAGFLARYQVSGQNPAVMTEEEQKQVPSFWRKWDDPDAVVADWPSMSLPTYWELAGLENMDGRVAFFRKFSLPAQPTGPTYINLGPIDETDHVFVNGTMVGETRFERKQRRRYQIPNDALKKGDNYVIVRVEDSRGNSGIGGQPEDLYLESGNTKIPLAGTWRYRVLERFKPTLNSSDYLDSRDLLAKFAAYNSMTEEEPVPEEEVEPDADVRQIVITAVKDQMQYAPREFTVRPEEEIEIVFENVDGMMHNLLIITPGNLELLGGIADKMAQQADGMEKNYIPDVPYVLFSIPLLSSGQTATLRFTAPAEPGDYPYVCTFPGHWRLMNGVMKVSNEVN